MVLRSQVRSELSVDIAGLRIYSPDQANRDFFARHLENPWAAQRFVTDTLSKARAETGVEPERIPVRGRRGDKLGTEGMILIKGGEFERTGRYLISNYVTEPYEVKGQRYTVRVSPFYIDRTKVTNQQFCDFLNDNNQVYGTPWNSRIVKNRSGLYVPADPILADIHVVSVTWFQAAGYAEWAGKRLPTEAEWEFAAGGPEGRKYPWGNEDPDDTRANFFGKRKYHTLGDAFPAGATPEGVFDLVGNSAEWIADYYDEDYYRSAPEDGVLIDPTGPGQGTAHKKYRRMFKGICKGFQAPGMLSVFKRHSRPPLLSSAPGIGFRCVKSVPPKNGFTDSTTDSIPEDRSVLDQPVKDFRLRDLMEEDPSFVSLSQFHDEKVVVLISIQSRCPFTWKYIERIGKLFEQYRDKGVAFLMIRSSLTDTEDRIRRYAEDKNLAMPLLYDEDNRVADYFGTRGTPYFYVIDRKGVLRYEGIFDNNQTQKRFELDPETVTSHYLRDALNSVLEDTPVKKKSVPTGAT